MTTGGHDETFRHAMAISYRHDDGNGVVQEVLGLELSEHRLGQIQPTYRVKDIGTSSIVRRATRMSLYLCVRSRTSLSPIELYQLLMIQCRARSAILFFLFEFVECLLGMFSNVILSNRGR